MTAAAESAAQRLFRLADPTRQRRFEAFYAEHNQSVFNILRHATKDPHLADDCTAEAFLQLFQCWEDIDPAKRRAWVIKVAFNHSKRWWRTRKRRQDRERRFAEQYPPLAPVLDPDQHLELTEAAAAIARLPRRQRQVMVLRHFTGFDPDEIAEILGISVRTVGVHEHRARQQLRAIRDGQEEAR